MKEIRYGKKWKKKEASKRKKSFHLISVPWKFLQEGYGGHWSAFQADGSEREPRSSPAPALKIFYLVKGYERFSYEMNRGLAQNSEK